MSARRRCSAGRSSVAAGEPAVVVDVGENGPAFVSLARDVRLGGLALGLQRVELAVESLVGRSSGCRWRSAWRSGRWQPSADHARSAPRTTSGLPVPLREAPEERPVPPLAGHDARGLAQASRSGRRRARSRRRVRAGEAVGRGTHERWSNRARGDAGRGGEWAPATSTPPPERGGSRGQLRPNKRRRSQFEHARHRGLSQPAELNFLNAPREATPQVDPVPRASRLPVESLPLNAKFADRHALERVNLVDDALAHEALRVAGSTS